MKINDDEYDFNPQLDLPPMSEVMIEVSPASGRARIAVRCAISKRLIEARPDCQVIEVEGKEVIVAAPGSIKRPKLGWKVKLLRWMAQD